MVFRIIPRVAPDLGLRDLGPQDSMYEGIRARGLLEVLVPVKKSPVRDLGFKSIAAQVLGFTSTLDRCNSNAASMKVKAATRVKRAMRAINYPSVGRRIGKYNPTGRYLRSKEAPVGEQLFPGIPDEITWHLIIPKLAWRACHILSSVSRAWEEAIRTNYAEKVCANPTETLIIHVHVYDDRDTIALFSTSENRCYELPGIPCLPRGVLQFCECVAVDRKIYVLGGREILGQQGVLKGGLVIDDPPSNRVYIATEEVYVLDLARRQWKWEQCASMLEPRDGFGCCVIDDKIYVFGSSSVLAFGKLLQSEVYDTQKNSWSPIMPMERTIGRRGVAITAPVGKELFLYHNHVRTLGVYNPAKNEWNFSERVWVKDFLSLEFVREGTIYSFSHSGIDVYDVERNSWINLHTHSLAARRPGSAAFKPVSIVAIKDELLLTGYWVNGNDRSYQSLHCKGFNSEEKELVWKETNCTFNRTRRRVLQVPIQL